MRGRLGRAALVFGTAVGLAGCRQLADRTLPVVEAGAPAPFLTASGPYPTQLQAKSAVDVAIERHGLSAVYASFGLDEPERLPASIALFACKPGLHRPSANRIEARGGFVHCHADVGDAAGRLIGRATMSFYFNRAGWRLASVLERERDAR